MADEPTTTDAPESTGTPAAEPDKTFSQADVDRIVEARVARVKATPPADYEDLKAAKTKLDQLEASQQTDIEKANKKIADLERTASDATTRAQESLLRASVIAEAAKRNVIDPDAAVALIDRSEIEFDDDGMPDIAKAMDSLLEQRAYLVAANGGARGNADQGARSASGVKQLTVEDLKSMSPEAVAQAEKEGRLANLLGIKT